MHLDAGVPVLVITLDFATQLRHPVLGLAVPPVWDLF